VTIRNVEVDGKWPTLANNGIGIDVNDHDVKAANNPGLWREGIVIENNYVHDAEGEGIYVGPNWFQKDLPLRNIVIRGNLVEDTGWNGINLKSAVDGVNPIYGNVVKRAGKKVDTSGGQHSAIAIYEGYASVFNNWVEDAGEAAIRQYVENVPASYGLQVFDVYNNVITNPGRTGPQPGYGVVSGSVSGMASPSPRVYNNTIVGATDCGIKIGSSAENAYVRNNVIVDSAAAPVSAPNTVIVASNLSASVSTVRFVDAAALDFRLQSTSPARNAATSKYPAADYDGVARPQDGAADQGAFEYTADTPRPNAPSGVAVE
jgi:hypothetical protein